MRDVAIDVLHERGAADCLRDLNDSEMPALSSSSGSKPQTESDAHSNCLESRQSFAALLCRTALWCFIAGYRSFQAEMLRRRQLLTRSFAGGRWNSES
jgi:hypothetical protein